MSYKLTPTTKALSQQTNKTPLLILEIEGSQYIYGSGPILERARWDDPRINWDNLDGVTWDGTIEIEKSRPYISLKDSTKNLSQQLIIEKGGAGSVPSFSIGLIDYRGEVARDLSFNQIGEPMGKRATVSTMLAGGVFPADANTLFEGYIDEIVNEAGLIKLNVTHPSNETRQPILEQLETILTQPLKYKTLELANIRFTQKANLLSTTAEIELVSGGSTSSDLLGNIVTVTYGGGARYRDIADAINNSSYVGGYIEAEIIGDPNALVSPLALTIFETDTTVDVEIANPFVETQDVLTSYIRINDEVMEVISKTSTSFEVTRGALGTVPTNHEVDDSVVSLYRLTGKPIDLALKLLLSSEDNEFSDSEVKITSINYIDNTQSIIGALVTDNPDVERKTKLTVGDSIELIGTANDGVYTISGFGKILGGTSYILVDANLSEELSVDVKVRYKSKFNVLPTGVGLDVNQVEVAEMENEQTIYSASFIENDFEIQETIENVKEFIEKELFRPQALYYLPKGSRISCKFTAPPFSIEELPLLNTSNCENMSKIRSKRSHHKYFKNVLVYRYNPDTIEEEFRDKLIISSESSFNRIRRGVKREIIESKGLRRSAETIQVLNSSGLRYLNRYKFGARWFDNVQVTYNVGIQLQVGDIIFFGGEDTQLVNLDTGERDLPVSQYEIVNLDNTYSEGAVKLTLLETGFSTEGIIGVFSPSGYVSAGSTVSRILLTDRVFDTEDTQRDREKFENFVGLKVRVYSDDYTRDETTTLSGLDLQNSDAIFLDPPLSFTPQVGDIIELAEYGQHGEEARLQLLKYTFTMPSVLLTGITDSQVFEVENIDGLEVGMEINVHSDDYVRDSETRIIDDINGLEITLDSPLNITPEIDDRLEVYNYAGAKGYRFL